MSSRETVIELVRKLPEEMSLAEIAREIELLAGIQTAREQAARGEGLPAEERPQVGGYMGHKVILTPQSLEDLEGIVTFIASNNSERSRTFGDELIDRALSTANFPELGRVVPEIGLPTVREIVHGSYRIIYEIFPDRGTIYVLRFWHGARGKPKIKPTG